MSQLPNAGLEEKMELAFKSTNEGSRVVPAQNMLQSHELDLIGIGLQAKEEPRLGEQANAGSRAKRSALRLPPERSVELRSRRWPAWDWTRTT